MNFNIIDSKQILVDNADLTIYQSISNIIYYEEENTISNCTQALPIAKIKNKSLTEADIITAVEKKLSEKNLSVEGIDPEFLTCLYKHYPEMIRTSNYYVVNRENKITSKSYQDKRKNFNKLITADQIEYHGIKNWQFQEPVDIAIIYDQNRTKVNQIEILSSPKMLVDREMKWRIIGENIWQTMNFPIVLSSKTRFNSIEELSYPEVLIQPGEDPLILKQLIQEIIVENITTSFPDWYLDHQVGDEIIIDQENYDRIISLLGIDPNQDYEITIEQQSEENIHIIGETQEYNVKLI